MAKAEKAPAAPKEPKEVKVKEPKKYAGHLGSATITLGSNKEGVQHGPKNNPKREGSASADRFALYKNGMTIDKALAAGVSAADIAFDSDPKRTLITIAD